jgi:hypothetical protein
MLENTKNKIIFTADDAKYYVHETKKIYPLAKIVNKVYTLLPPNQLTVPTEIANSTKERENANTKMDEADTTSNSDTNTIPEPASTINPPTEDKMLTYLHSLHARLKHIGIQKVLDVVRSGKVTGNSIQI